MTTFTPNAKNHASLGPLASRLVHVNELPWEPIEYPGVYVKTLLFDRESGLLTVLMKMDPGAELPDPSMSCSEQTYVLKGRLVDKEGTEIGLTAGPGDFVWRPAGSRSRRMGPGGRPR